MCHPDRDSVSVSPGEFSTRNVTIQTGGVDLPVFEATPRGRSQASIVIIHDIFGANPFYHDLARRLASVGYTAYLPDLFVRQGPLPEQTYDEARARGSQLSFPQAMEDLGVLAGTIERERGGSIGTVGFCMGGTLVMLLAAREPRFAAGVIYYGFPRNANRTENRPHEPIEEAGDIQVPLLGFWGDQDHGVGMDNVETYRAALATHNKQHDFTIYPGLPHGFLTFDESSSNYADSQDSWTKTLLFYQQHLS